MIIAADCPICMHTATTKHHQTPYWICPNCDAWFQSPMPPKQYHGIHEGIPGVMSEGDRQINRNIAAWLFRDVMGSKPGPILDIGASLPVLASALADLGCEAHCIEGDPVPNLFSNVTTYAVDFEDDPGCDPTGKPYYDLIIMVHTFEHMYRPVDAMRKVRALLNPGGRVYMRLPQHDVTGIERDITPGHFTVHPYVHSLSSILEILKQTNTFTIKSYTPMPGWGQADFVMVPI